MSKESDLWDDTIKETRRTRIHLRKCIKGCDKIMEELREALDRLDNALEKKYEDGN